MMDMKTEHIVIFGLLAILAGVLYFKKDCSCKTNEKFHLYGRRDNAMYSDGGGATTGH